MLNLRQPSPPPIRFVTCGIVFYERTTTTVFIRANS